MWYIHIIDYYSVFKKEEFLTYVTWMNLENMMLNKISQSQKDKYCNTNTDMYGTKNSQTHRNRM